MSKPQRPLSPHLQVYRLKLHMVMSGLHRITGLALGVGAFVLAWWATALATSEDYYEFFESLMAHPIGRLVLFGFSFALIFHALNGIRHLLWDTGRGFEKGQVKTSGIIVIILTIILTVAVWVLAYMQAGKI